MGKIVQRSTDVEWVKLGVLKLLDNATASPATEWVTHSHLRSQLATTTLFLHDAKSRGEVKPYINVFSTREPMVDLALAQMNGLVEEEAVAKAGGSIRGGRRIGQRYRITEAGAQYLAEQWEKQKITLEEAPRPGRQVVNGQHSR